MKLLSNISLLDALPLETKSEDDDETNVVKALSDLQTAFTGKVDTINAEVKALSDRIDAEVAKRNRPGTETKADEVSEERKAWLTYIRKGAQTDDIIIKALTVADDTRAGYLAPPEVSTEMIRELTEISPIRQFATVRQSMAQEVRYPKRTGITNAKWEDETEESEKSTVTFGQTTIASRRLTTYVDISNSLLKGSDGAAEAEVRIAFAEDFAQKQGLAFVSGDGVKEPEGILTSPAVQYVPNGHASNLSADSLITLMYSLPAIWRNRGVWILNASTVATIRKMKDGQGNYLWQPSYQAGQPETILGRPIAEAPDMPDATSGKFPIAFGDLGTGYRIIDRMQLGTLTDPYTQATRAITRIHGTVWVSGAVIQPAAIKKLKMSTN